MAIIYSVRNDNGGAHSTISPTSTSTWAGGVVPGAADQVYVVGRRTQINQAAFSKWTGTITITVSSTANFASSGYFYTVTNGGEIIKVNYTGTTSTTFTGCSLDETDPFYAWTSGQQVPNTGYVHNPAHIIEIPTGVTVEYNELIIQEGGYVLINGGTLILNQGILVRDGRLIGRNGGTITIRRNSAALANMGYLTGENFQLSIIDIEGDENRVYATTQSPVSAGASSVTVNAPTNGSFAVGDEVALYELEDYRRRNKGYTGYRDASANFRDMDEGFDVAGVNGNTIYLALRNHAKGVIRAVETRGAHKVLEVLPDNLYFNKGDKILVNNVTYTIDAVDDSERIVYEYDFTDPATSLSDFWVNDSTHAYSSGWEIESGVGLRNTSGSYRELINKFFWTREVILEAELSPLSGYSTGTRGTAAFGLCAAYDPAFRSGHRGYDSFKSDYLAIDDSGQDLAYYIRSMSNYPNNRPDRVTSILNKTRGPATYRVVSRKSRTQAYLDGLEITTEFRRDGHFKGLVGLYTNGNTNFRCKTLRIKEATQKLYVTTTNSFTVNDTVWTTGIDHSHPAGSRLLKLASVNTGGGNHKDLGFAYSGQYGSGVWPHMIQINGTPTTNNSLPYIHNHDMNFDYYLNLGDTTSARSVTLDLTAQTTFTHVSFVSRMQDLTPNWSKMTGVAIYGSNDLTNWTTLYGPTNDTKNWSKVSYNRMAFYPTGTVSYRYVKFETKGSDASPYVNRYVNIGVHDFSDGYNIVVNNASDFSEGDTVTVLSDSGFNWGSRELEAYYATVSNSTDPETFYHSGWNMECTIVNKVGNKLYLDRPIFWGYVEGEDSVTVVKTNRKFTIQGTYAPTGTTNDWRWPNIYMNDGGSLCRRYLFKQIRFNYVGSYRYSGSTTANRGIITAADDYWNHTMLDGCVVNMTNDGNTWGGVGANSSSGMIVRNCYLVGTASALFIYFQSSYSGSAFINNKFQSGAAGFYAENPKAHAVNYNEISMCDIGIRSYGYRVERGVIPAPNEIRFNYIKGISQYAFGLGAETAGPRRWPRMKIEYNKIRASDDFSFVGNSFSAWPYIATNAMSEHTGSRLSRYRNEGHFSQGDTSSDLSWTTPQHNYGGFGYDITNSLYYTAERDYSRPGVTRIYSMQGDALLWALGIELDVLEDGIPFEVFVRFDYRMPLVANLQDDGTDDGRLRLYALQQGEIKGSIQYGIVPSLAGTGWNTFTGVFNSFSAVGGAAGVFLNRSAQNGYIDYRNSHAEVRTDYPDKIRVVGNTFNLERIWEQYGEVRDIRTLTAPTRTINIRRLRF